MTTLSFHWINKKQLQSLTKILAKLKTRSTQGNLERKIKNIIFDSRKVEKDSLFVAVKGIQSDGHRFIESAIEKGATTIVCETLPEKSDQQVTFIQVDDSAEALGFLASAFYDFPSKQLNLIGITGTNGKTSTVTLLYKLLTELGFKVGLISTVENKIGKKVLSTKFTTPDAVSLNALIEEMVAQGCDYAFMEVSSHAVSQHRIAGVHFAGGVFTNLTHDHLDYHKTFKDYLNAKKRFFDNLPKESFALVNIDDKNGSVMVQNTNAQIKTYALRNLADYKAKIIENSLLGLHLYLDDTELFSRLIGEFNAYNLLCAYSVASLLGINENEMLPVISNLQTAEGRFDYIQDKKSGVTAIVDYAHTPDALEKVLSTIDHLRTRQEKVITVVGCGGDRDKTKRPVMTATACKYSDQVIITSDNPRTEDPETIIKEMEAGIPASAKRKVLSITNRLQAIRTACQMASKGDIILVAGKGHEKYQEINGVRHDFDDKAVLASEMKA